MRGDDVPDDYPLPGGGSVLTVDHLLRVSSDKTLRIARLEAVVRRYHDWHLKNGGDDDGYLESGLYEDACTAVPGLAQIGKN